MSLLSVKLTVNNETKPKYTCGVKELSDTNGGANTYVTTFKDQNTPKNWNVICNSDDGESKIPVDTKYTAAVDGYDSFVLAVEKGAHVIAGSVPVLVSNEPWSVKKQYIMARPEFTDTNGPLQSPVVNDAIKKVDDIVNERQRWWASMVYGDPLSAYMNDEWELKPGDSQIAADGVDACKLYIRIKRSIKPCMLQQQPQYKTSPDIGPMNMHITLYAVDVKPPEPNILGLNPFTNEQLNEELKLPMDSSGFLVTGIAKKYETPSFTGKFVVVFRENDTRAIASFMAGDSIITMSDMLCTRGTDGEHACECVVSALNMIGIRLGKDCIEVFAPMIFGTHGNTGNTENSALGMCNVFKGGPFTYSRLGFGWLNTPKFDREKMTVRMVKSVERL